MLHLVFFTGASLKSALKFFLLILTMILTAALLYKKAFLFLQHELCLLYSLGKLLPEQFEIECLDK